MAYDDTKWGGFAKIIVDTSTMTVGDTVRVKSVTTGTNYDKQVATVGTPLIWETDIYKDYVKICMVQTINDTPTEIGGVYKTVDYGQTLFINALNKTSLAGIQGILNAGQHQTLLNVGDEVNITVSGSPFTMIIGGFDVHEQGQIVFVAKKLWATSVWRSDRGSYNNSALRAKAQDFYSQIGAKDKTYIKEMSRASFPNYNQTTQTWEYYDDYVWIPNAQEVNGSASTALVPMPQFPIFTTQANRIKTYENSAKEWWTSNGRGSEIGAYGINTSGTTTNYAYSQSLGVLPCFQMLADS